VILAIERGAEGANQDGDKQERFDLSGGIKNGIDREYRGSTLRGVQKDTAHMAIPENSKSPQSKPVPTPAPSTGGLKPPVTTSTFAATNLRGCEYTTTTPPITTPHPTPHPTYGWGSSAPYGWSSKK